MVSSLNCVARRQSASVAGDSCAPSLMGAVCLWELDSFTAKASWHQSVVRKTAVCGHRDPAQVFRNGRKTCAASRYNITGFYSITTGLCFFFFFIFIFIFFSRPAHLLLQMKLRSSSHLCSAANHCMVLNHSYDAPEPWNFRLKFGMMKVSSFLHLTCQFKKHAVWNGYSFVLFVHTIQCHQLSQNINTTSRITR